MALANLDEGAAKIEIGGVAYRVGRYRVRHLAEMQRLLESQRDDPLSIVSPYLDTLPAKQQEILLDRVYDDLVRERSVSMEDVERHLQTFEGVCFAVWQAIREEQANVAKEQIRKLLGDLSPRQFSEVVEQCFEAMGLTPGNLPGQVPEAD